MRVVAEEDAPVPADLSDADWSLTDDELRLRTQALLLHAQRISAELFIQTERLNHAIDQFSQQYIRPRREDPQDDNPAA